MPSTLVSVIIVKSTGRQVVPIAVKARSNSPITTLSGTVQLQLNATFTAEDDRFDQAQLQSLTNNGVIVFERTRQLVTITEDDDGSSGATGS